MKTILFYANCQGKDGLGNLINNLLPGQFKINVGNSGQTTGFNNAKDPITDGTSSYIWTGMGNISASSIDGVPNAVTWTSVSNEIPNRGYFLSDTTTGETVLVEKLNTVPLTVELETSFSDTWVTGGAGTFITYEDASHIYFPFGDVKDNKFNGYYLYNFDSDESRVITGYSEKYGIITLESAFTGWAVTDRYQISKTQIINGGLPPYGTITGNTIEITNGVNVDDIYNNMIIKFADFSGTPGTVMPTEYNTIIDYDGATRIATLQNQVPAFTPIYSISNFTKDIYSFLDVGNSYENKRKLYDVSLNNIILPNQILDITKGGRISSIPYVYVTVSNTSIGTTSLTLSNNPNSYTATFRCPINDNSNSKTSSFIKIRSNQVQTFEFNIYEDINFEVILPDGTLFKTLESDNVSPNPPNPSLQISTVFSFEPTVKIASP